MHNMGTADRIIRGAVVAPAAILLAFGVGAGTILGVVFFTVAGLMLATAAVGFCPLYRVLGIDTRGRGPVAHGRRA